MKLTKKGYTITAKMDLSEVYLLVSCLREYGLNNIDLLNKATDPDMKKVYRCNAEWANELYVQFNDLVKRQEE